jgi:phage terminase small subunit
MFLCTQIAQIRTSTSMKSRKPKPPAHLKPATRRWWSGVLEDFVLEAHHVRLLTLAAEAWDRGEEAREAIAEHGLTFQDRFGEPRTRPEVAVERHSRTSFAKFLRELALDITPPPESTRLPGRPGTGR